MDRELEQAQDLTRDDLVKKLENGRPANLAAPTIRISPPSRSSKPRRTRSPVLGGSCSGQEASHRTALS